MDVRELRTRPVGNPKGIDKVTVLEDQPEMREKLKSKIIYYEVELQSYVKRRDITGDQTISKSYVKEGEPCSSPTENDELFLNIKVFQKEPEEVVLFQKEAWYMKMATEPLMNKVFEKVLTSLRKGEESQIHVKAEILTQEEDEKNEQERGLKFPGINTKYDVFMHIELINSIACQDFFRDKTTFKRVFEKGRGGNPYIESAVKFRLKAEVDGTVVFNNLRPQTQKKIAMLPGREDQEILEKLKEVELVDNTPKTEKEKRAEYFKKINPPEEEEEDVDQDLGMALEEKFYATQPSGPEDYIMAKLDDYQYPALLIKMLTSMKRGEVSELDSTKLIKARNNFEDEIIALQSKVGEESKDVRLTVELIDYTRNLPSMYRLKLNKKKERIERLKTIAAKFFKAGNVKRSCKLYQKINGYFNFGDISNNFQKEDEESPEFKETMEAMLGIKKSCFINVVVCKWKMQQYTSVVNIAEQVLSDMDSENVKCLYFLGKANAAQEKYQAALVAYKRLLELNPENAEVKNEVAEVNRKYKKEVNTQSQFYSQMFK